MNDSSFCLQFHSHFSDNRRQDVSTTNAHMKMIDNLKLNNQGISECTELNSVWEIETIDKEQKRYTISDRCKLNNIFESLNHRRVVNLEISKIDKIDDDDLAKEILHGTKSRISEKIMKSDYGAMRTDNPATNRCYIVEWSSNVYTVQDDIVMKGYNPPKCTHTGEIVYEARF